MLEKKRRVPRDLFTKIFQDKKSVLRRVASDHFSLSIYLNESKISQAAVSVSKKVSNKAVSRNKVRRRAYSLLRTMLPKLREGIYFISAKPGADKLEFETFKKEFENLFKSFNH